MATRTKAKTEALEIMRALDDHPEWQQATEKHRELNARLAAAEQDLATIRDRIQEQIGRIPFDLEQAVHKAEIEAAALDLLGDDADESVIDDLHALREAVCRRETIERAIKLHDERTNSSQHHGNLRRKCSVDIWSQPELAEEHRRITGRMRAALIPLRDAMLEELEFRRTLEHGGVGFGGPLMKPAAIPQLGSPNAPDGFIERWLAETEGYAIEEGD